MNKKGIILSPITLTYGLGSINLPILFIRISKKKHINIHKNIREQMRRENYHHEKLSDHFYPIAKRHSCLNIN